MMRNIVNALFIRDGKVLLARRSPHRRAYPGLWSFPGGHVEQHETRAEALVKEVPEEVGVVPTSFSFLISISDPKASEHRPATYHFYSVSAWEGGEPILLGEEHIELKWFSVPMAIALPDLALDEYRTLLGQYVRLEGATNVGSRRPGLVIFDCDGVLVDSELIETRIRSECLRAAGFPMTAEELGSNSGISGRNLIEMIENRFGRPLPEDFMAATRTKIMSAFTVELRAIEGVSELLQSLTVPVCVASNSHPDRVRHGSLAVFRSICIQRHDGFARQARA
jgi:8-oxo-dGTP diphosphatase